MEELISKLKSEIIETLELKDISTEDFDSDKPFFGDDSFLDSIDLLDLIVLLEKNYGIKINDPKEGRKIIHSVRTMAEYIMLLKKNE